MHLVADVRANVVCTALVFGIGLSLVFRPSLALKVAGLVELASRRVDITTLAQGDIAVVTSTRCCAAVGDIGTRELVANALVDTRLKG